MKKVYFWNWVWQCAAKMTNLSLMIVDPQLMFESWVEYEKNSSSSESLLLLTCSCSRDRFSLVILVAPAVTASVWGSKSFLAFPSPQTEKVKNTSPTGKIVIIQDLFDTNMWYGMVKKCKQIIFWPKSWKSGQKTINFVQFSKSGKWHYTKYRTFKHP